MRIECELGEMRLEIEGEDASSSRELFEKIWQNRVEERRQAQAFTQNRLTKQRWFDDLFE